ncbi:MAG TPA: glycosyltransferase family 39 protein [Polyangiaceae bacterium]|nr:glycosyltransferase family 39 protein [Polyangiaceae bacterium]
MSASNEPLAHADAEVPANAAGDERDGAPAASPRPASAPRVKPRGDAWALPAAVVISVLFLGALVGKSGIWDPFELNVAELSRRIAVNAFGARHLVLEGADNSMPKIGELGRGELPFDSIAIGLRVFGLHDWAGRAPLVVWGLFGVGALYWLLARLVNRRAALYGAVILSTMPLYFLHARTMLGEIVTMAALSIATAGLGIATFDRPGSPRMRQLALGVGLIGLGAGFLSRGLLVGVAAPALGVGLSWVVTLSAGPSRRELLGEGAGFVSLLIGATATAIGVGALLRATSTEYSMLVGATIVSQPKFPTFDFVIHYLGHGLLPWSAFIPFAAGRLFRSPTAAQSQDEEAEQRASAARLLMLVSATIAFGVYSVMAQRVGYLAFGAPALLAAIAAIALVDFDEGAPASPALAVGVAVFVALFYRDYNMFPEKGFSAFAVNAPSFPEAFKARAESLIMACSAVFAFFVFFAWLEEQKRPWFRASEYLAWPRVIGRVVGMKIVLIAALLEAILIIVAGASYVGLHFTHSKYLLGLGLRERLALLNAFWVLPALLLLPVWGAMVLRDAFRLFFDKTRMPRGMATVAAGLACGGILSFVYYPALAAQLSPKEVYESYRALRAPGEPLGLLGVGGKTAAYYSGGNVKIFADVQTAYNWLTETTDRRWLGVRNEDLPKLNSLYRAGTDAKASLPVLDARSGQILLVSNQLLRNEGSQNPYGKFVFDKEPPIGHRVEANMQDVLLSLGWDVTDSSGEAVSYIVPARKYRFRLYYKVLAPIKTEWETFVHIEGQNRRFNADHRTLQGKYGLALWQPGDYIVDEHEFSLEPNFAPGEYVVRYGLFSGETRLKVQSGQHDENRIMGGTITVQ